MKLWLLKVKNKIIILFFYSLQNNEVNVTFQIINEKNYQYNLTLSRFTNIIVDQTKNITVNCNSNSFYNL